MALAEVQRLLRDETGDPIYEDGEGQSIAEVEDATGDIAMDVALSLAESAGVRASIDLARILKARFAHKDKNHAAQKAQPGLGPRPKARLCASGQFNKMDLSVDAPTAGRQSLLLAVQLALCRGWVASIGDIRAAFLNGGASPGDFEGSVPAVDQSKVVVAAAFQGAQGAATSPGGAVVDGPGGPGPCRKHWQPSFRWTVGPTTSSSTVDAPTCLRVSR